MGVPQVDNQQEVAGVRLLIGNQSPLASDNSDSHIKAVIMPGKLIGQINYFDSLGKDIEMPIEGQALLVHHPKPIHNSPL